MFEVGTLVICNIPGMYSCTDTDALCIVMEKGRSYMDVKIIATNRMGELNSTHNVNPNFFEEITAGKYLFKFPSAYKCANFDKIVGDYTEEYNKYNQENQTGIAPVQKYNTTKKYIDFNKDSEYTGKEDF